jgi:hypothetical protein
MLPSHHLLTVGISLLTNFAKTRGLAADEAARHHRAIADFLEADRRKACAEINSLDSRTGLLSGALMPRPERLPRHIPAAP